DSAEDPHWRLLAAILKRWIGEHAGPVLLVPLPLYQYVEETADAAAYRQRFRELAADAGCRLHDPLPDLLAYPAAERRGFRFGKDIHLSRAGHQAVARSLVPAVEAALAPAGALAGTP